MSKLKKFDKIKYGIILGLVLPVISFSIFYLFVFGKVENLSDLLRMEEFKVPLATVGILPGLILFYIFLRMEMNEISKGLMFLSLVYTVILLFTLV